MSISTPTKNTRSPNNQLFYKYFSRNSYSFLLLVRTVFNTALHSLQHSVNRQDIQKRHLTADKRSVALLKIQQVVHSIYFQRAATLKHRRAAMLNVRDDYEGI